MSLITFKENTEFQICVGLDDEQEPIFETESALKDEEHDVDLLEACSEDLIGIQFGNGDVAYIRKDLITIKH